MIEQAAGLYTCFAIFHPCCPLEIIELFHRDLSAKTGVGGVVDLYAAGNVVLGFRCFVPALENFVCDSNIESIRASTRAERDQQDAITGFGYIQGGGQADD